MTSFCQTHRFPRAGSDPIDDAGAQLVIESMLALPARAETIVVLLDHERRGVSIIDVDGTHERDAVHDVAELVAQLALRMPEVGAVVIASVRPGGSDDLDDVDRWLDLDERLALAGVELVEWFVYGRSLCRPRVLLGDASRWEP